MRFHLLLTQAQPQGRYEVACADQSSMRSREPILDLIYGGFETRKQPRGNKYEIVYIDPGLLPTALPAVIFLRL